MAGVLMVVIGALGVALWYQARPTYRTFTSHPAGNARTILQFHYPSDWEVHHCTVNMDIPSVQIDLTHRSSGGLQRWIEQHFYGNGLKSWTQSSIEIHMFPGTQFHSLDEEVRRLNAAMQQMVRITGGTFALHKFFCQAGPGIEVELNPTVASPPLPWHGAFFVFPQPVAEQPYEVTARYNGPTGLQGRLRQVAYDVVCRSRLVREDKGTLSQDVRRERRNDANKTVE